MEKYFIFITVRTFCLSPTARVFSEVLHPASRQMGEIKVLQPLHVYVRGISVCHLTNMNGRKLILSQKI